MQILTTRSARPQRLFPDLAALLDDYQAAAARLVEQWPAISAYTELSTRLDPIRKQASHDPELSAVSVQLVIAHSELVSVLSERTAGRVQPEKLAQVQNRHRMCIAALRGAISA